MGTIVAYTVSMGSMVTRLMMVLTACLPLFGCVAEEAPAASQVSDSTQVTVHAGELGSSFDFAVTVKPAGLKAGDDHVKLVRFQVPVGVTFAVVMRKQGDSALNPYLALYPPDSNEKVAVSDWDQALLPMAAEDDGVVVHTAERSGDFLAFAADLDLNADGSFQLDILQLDTEPVTLDLTVTDPGVRTINDLLRQDEAELLDYLVVGALSEGPDGFVVKHLEALGSLKERVALNGFTAHLNDLREQFYRAFVWANGAGGDGALEAQVGTVCGALWPALRSESHVLR